MGSVSTSNASTIRFTNKEPLIYTKQSEDEDVAQIFFHKLVEDLKFVEDQGDLYELW